MPYSYMEDLGEPRKYANRAKNIKTKAVRNALLPAVLGWRFRV